MNRFILTRNMSDSALYGCLCSSIKKQYTTEMDSVEKWLEDLRCMTEPECLSVLQSKSIQTTVRDRERSERVFMVRDAICSLKKSAESIMDEFAQIFQSLNEEKWKIVYSETIQLTGQVRGLLYDSISYLQNIPSDVFQHQQYVLDECTKLVKHAEIFKYVNGKKPEKMPVVRVLTSLGHSFLSIVDMVLSYFMKILIEGIYEDLASANVVTSSICCLVSLAKHGNKICSAIVQAGGIQALFEVCKQETPTFVKSSALRALAVLISSVPEYAEEIGKADGISRLSSVLRDPHSPETIKSDAAGVVAHITSPGSDHQNHALGLIENMEDLISSLTELCNSTSNPDTFLVGVAAVANITFMDSMACDFLCHYGAARIFIRGCRKRKLAPTMYAKDQISTILANMAVSDQCRTEISREGGIQLLTSFLYERPKRQKNSPKKLAHSDFENEKVACERVLQKSAIALARLSKENSCAELIYQSSGITRLVQLCRQSKERMNSDSVLVASLACLRKLYSILRPFAFEPADVEQLIQPRLMDSFLLCSSMEESFV